MKKFLAAIALLLLLPCSSPAVDSLNVVTIYTDAAVASTGTITSDALRVDGMGGIESILFQATSVSGTADVKIEYLVCVTSTTCGTVADIADLTASSLLSHPGGPEQLNRILMPVVGAPYIKFTITGVASNPADALFDLYIVYRSTVN